MLPEHFGVLAVGSGSNNSLVAAEQGPWFLKMKQLYSVTRWGGGDFMNEVSRRGRREECHSGLNTL